MKRIFAGLTAALFITGFPLHANADLVGEWLFENGVNDTSGNEILTQAYGGVSEIVRDGEKAQYFNGTTGYLALDKKLEGSLDGLGLSVWFNTSYMNPNGANYTNWAFLDFDRSEYFNLSIDNVGQIWFGMTTRNNSTTLDFFSDETFNDGKWHQLVLSYGQTNGLKVHVDRDLIIDDVYRGSIGRPGVVRYGFIGDGSEANSFNGNRNQRYFEGGLDNVVLLDNELTDTNVYNFFSNGYSAVSDVSMPGASLGLLSLGLLVGFRRKK